MSDHTPNEDAAFQADMDRLRAQIGAARLEEAARRGIGEQMLQAAMEGIERAELLELIKGSVHQCDPSELPTWIEVDPDDYRRDTPTGD
jgi:hypothetical protein